MTLPAPASHKKSKIPLKVLLYGLPGATKTSFAAGAAELGKELVFDVEGGMLSVPSNENIIVQPISAVNHMPDGTTLNCMDFLEKYLWALSARDLKANPWMEDLQTVVLDSGSEFLGMSTETIVRSKLGGPTIKGKPARTNPNEVYKGDWGEITTAMIRLFRHLRDLPYNVVMTALAKPIFPPTKNDEQVEPIEIRPAFTQKLAESVMGFFDMVWFIYPTVTMVDGKTVTTIRIMAQPYGIYRIKTRGQLFAPALGPIVENPTFSSIHALLNKTEGGL